jgi:hypothetical protein
MRSAVPLYPAESVLPPVPRLSDLTNDADTVQRDLSNALPYFPAIPPAHTYRATPAFEHEPLSADAAAAAESRSKRRIVRSLSSLEVRFFCIAACCL